MAGIGYELRKLLQKDSLLALIRAYAYAGLISSGPWVLSILGMLAIGLLSFSVVKPDMLITQFQVTVTNLICYSLILTGFFQLSFTRFVADRLFEKKEDVVVANYHGVLMVVICLSGILSFVCAIWLFPQQTILYRLLLISSFVVLCMIWIATVFLSGLKQYLAIVILYFVGYSVTVGMTLLLRPLGTEGLLLGFLIGQIILFLSMHGIIFRNFPAPIGILFDAFSKARRYPTLMWIGFLYNFGAWADKIIFWYWPATSQDIIGPLRASVIYDLPVFLAYLSIIPGMAIFLVRIETDFVDHYNGFYNAVRLGGSLEKLESHRNGMVETVRLGLFEIAKIQALTTLLIFVVGDRLLNAVQISTLYLPLLHVQVIAAGFQVIFLSILTVYFYLDKRKIVLMLCSLFVVLNIVFTIASLLIGPTFYGYGFALALLIVVVVGLISLEKTLSQLEYTTFMLQ
jgi:polysaccharide biosynthesis protein PelG